MSASRREELSVMVAGQGGDGSLTLATLLSDLLGGRGLELYQARNVASRIKGGHAAAYVRASVRSRRCLADRLDLLIAFDEEALAQGAPWLGEGSYVVYDASEGPPRAARLPAGATLLEVPFGRLAVRDLRRDLYKNSLAFGLAARLVGAEDGEAEATLRASLGRLPPALVEANVQALRHGFAYAEARGIRSGQGPWRLGRQRPGRRLLLSGNEALAFAFMVAGGRFFAGYPITPASEILDCLARWLPQVGGLAVQAEDELAAVNLALGAAMAGVRAMTASSGPGTALMQEGVGHLGSAEIGLVIVDCQRAGPSTGMPTKPEQSDLGMLAAGANGDIPRVVLAPGDPAWAFRLTALAVDLAERMQGPVYLALDQAVAQNATTVPRFDLDEVRVERSLLGESEVAAMEEYRRYRLTEDGISPWAPFGSVGAQHLVTGNERDEWGRVSTEPGNRARMVEKRLRKLETVRPLLPRGCRFGAEDAPVGLLAFGMAAGAAREAAERLAQAGLPVRGLEPLTLFPVLEDVADLVRGCARVYVVEHNAGGQYARLLAGAGLPRERVRSVLRYDGLPFRPGELAAAILEQEG
jgi:2-oxoglutarate ferredoxin oxidoreductase subunit alpha